jgi:hypothetical protein
LKSAEEIIEKLKNSFNAPSRKDEKFKAVVVCILISTTFWFFSALNKTDYTTQIDHPVEFIFDETQFMPIIDLPEKLRIEVTGGGWDLMTRSFGFGMEAVQINLSDPSSSKYQLTSTLRGDLSANMTNINLNFILNDTLFYNIQKIVKRRIPIVFDSISLILEVGFEMTSPIQIDPQYIEFEGPENFVNAISNPFIIYPDDNIIDEDVNEQFEIPSLSSSLIRPSVSEVRAIFSVIEFFEYDREISVSLVNNTDSLITIEPANMRAYYKKSEDYTSIPSDSLEIEMVADFFSLNPADSTISIQIVRQASYIKDLRLESDKVKVRYD